MNSYII